MILHYRNQEIKISRMGVVCFSYGFDYRKLRSYSAPFVRLFTGLTYNHGAIFIEMYGELYLIESAENGVERLRLVDTIDRNKARIIIKEYTGTRTPEQVYKAAISMLHKKYDYAALLHQLIYRITGFIAFSANNFLGYKKFKGLWLGKKGEKAKGRHGCFELIYNAFGFANAHLASGAEFEKRTDFTTLFNELEQSTSIVPAYQF